MGNHVPLVEKFVESPAYKVHSLSLIEALEETTAKLPVITCRACELFLEQVGTVASNVMRSEAGTARIVAKLVVRIYSQTANATLHKRCLDMMDRMAEMQTYGFDEVLDLFDR